MFYMPVLVLTLLVLTIRLIMHVAVCLLDLAMVVDCSVSPTPGVNNYEYVKDFMVDIISSLNVKKKKTHVGAVSFGTQLERCCHFVSVNRCYALILSNCR